MIALNFEEFKKGEYEDIDDVLYMVKDKDTILYVGICNHGAWNRWFGEWTSHLMRDYEGEWFATSSIGRTILENMPNSLSWTIELWTFDDCLKFLGYDELSDNQKGSLYCHGMRRLEAEIIHKLNPPHNFRNG